MALWKTAPAAARRMSLLYKLSPASLSSARSRSFASSATKNAKCIAQLPPSQNHRPFSSSNPDKDTTTGALPSCTDDEEEGELLYQRSLDRLGFPRFLLGMTTLHTTYWIWYVLDFTPTVNAAAKAKNAEVAEAIKNGAAAVDASNTAAAGAVEAFSGIDPTIGYLGLGMAIMMSLGSAAFPRHLISEIRKGPASVGAGSLRVGVHNLPFCMPQTGKNIKVYAPAEVTIDSTVDAENVFKKHNGDLRKQRGFLALRAEGTRANLLLNIGSKDEIKREDLLLNYILPSGMKHGQVPIKRGGDGNDNVPLAGRKKRKATGDPRKMKQREARQLRRRQ